MSSSIDNLSVETQLTVASVDVGAKITTLDALQEQTKEPTGFPSRTTSTMSFDDGTRTFSIEPVGESFEYYVVGDLYTVSEEQTVVISDTEGIHFIYFDGDTLVDDPSPPNVNVLSDVAYVAVLYWSVAAQSAIYFGEERHGTTMSGATHNYLHNTFGTRYISGLALGSFTADGDGSSASHVQFSCASGVIYDEDIVNTITAGSPQALASPAEIPVLYRTGLTLWHKKDSNVYPVLASGDVGYTGGSGRLAYNEFTGGAWQLTEVGEGHFVLMHFYATNDINHPVVAILGSSTYTTAENAKNGVNEEVALWMGMPFAEFTPIGAVIYQTSSSYTNAVKARVVSTSSGSYIDMRDVSVLRVGSAANDHGSLAGLDGDDHPQYMLVNGGRAMTNNLNMGGNQITNVGNVDGVDVSAHASRHNPGGSDAIATAAATTLTATTTNTEGTATSVSRSDHTHAITTGAASTQTPDQSNAAGSSASLARADHIHNIPAGTPITTLTATTTNAKGTAADFALSDHTHAISTGAATTLTASTTNTTGTGTALARADHTHAITTGAASAQTPDQTNDAGVSASLSRADHVHNIATAAAVTLDASSTNTQGNAATFARSNHTHALTTGAATTLTAATINAAGTSASLARADHTHAITTGAASSLDASSTNTAGSSASLARADHTHAIGTAAVGDITTIQPDATASAGTSSNYARGDHRHAIDAAAPSSNLTATTTNAEGASTSFSRADHSHAITTGAASTLTPELGNSAGTSASLARADHIHDIPSGAATTLTASTTNTEGTASAFARTDHTHAITTGAASSITTSTANAAGSSASLARADHLHKVSLTTLNLTSTTTTTTNSATDVAISGMTFTTPAAGDYLVFFNGSFSHGSSNGAATFSVYTNTTQATASEVKASRGGPQGNVTIAIAITGVLVTVNGLEDISIRWRTSTGTASLNGHRRARIVKVN